MQCNDVRFYWQVIMICMIPGFYMTVTDDPDADLPWSVSVILCYLNPIPSMVLQSSLSMIVLTYIFLLFFIFLLNMQTYRFLYGREIDDSKTSFECSKMKQGEFCSIV